MQDVTKTEERYRAIVGENRELRSETSTLHQQLRQLENARQQQAEPLALLAQSNEILQALDEKYPGLSIPKPLLEGLGRLARGA